MNSLYSNSTFEMGKYFSYSAAFLNIYKMLSAIQIHIPLMQCR